MSPTSYQTAPPRAHIVTNARRFVKPPAAAFYFAERAFALSIRASGFSLGVREDLTGRARPSSIPSDNPSRPETEIFPPPVFCAADRGSIPERCWRSRRATTFAPAFPEVVLNRTPCLPLVPQFGELSVRPKHEYGSAITAPL